MQAQFSPHLQVGVLQIKPRWSYLLLAINVGVYFAGIVAGLGKLSILQCFLGRLCAGSHSRRNDGSLACQ